MAESGKEDIILMAIFAVTKGDILACANELGISEEQVTDEVIELVKEKVSQGLGDWREVIKGIAKETIKEEAIKKEAIKEEAIKEEAIKCPLGLVCSPACTWREVGKCISPRGVR